MRVNRISTVRNDEIQEKYGMTEKKEGSKLWRKRVGEAKYINMVRTCEKKTVERMAKKKKSSKSVQQL